MYDITKEDLVKGIFDLNRLTMQANEGEALYEQYSKNSAIDKRTVNDFQNFFSKYHKDGNLNITDEFKYTSIGKLPFKEFLDILNIQLLILKMHINLIIYKLRCLIHSLQAAQNNSDGLTSSSVSLIDTVSIEICSYPEILKYLYENFNSAPTYSPYTDGDPFEIFD